MQAHRVKVLHDQQGDMFSPAQNEALRKAHSILSEHFHDALIVVGARIEPPDNEPATEGGECTRILNVGSHKEAIANCVLAHSYFMSNTSRS